MAPIRRPSLKTIAHTDLLARSGRADVVVEARSLVEKPKKPKITLADLKKATAKSRALPTLVDQPIQPMIEFSDKAPTNYADGAGTSAHQCVPKTESGTVKNPTFPMLVEPLIDVAGEEDKPREHNAKTKQKARQTSKAASDEGKKPRYSVKPRRFNPDDVEVIVPVGTLAKLLSLVSCALHSELTAQEELDLVSSLKDLIGAAAVRKSIKDKSVEVDYFVDGIMQRTPIETVLTDLVTKAEVVRQDLIVRTIEHLKAQAT